MSPSDLPSPSLRPFVARSLQAVAVVSAAAFVAAAGGWLPTVSWNGVDWSTALPRLVLLASILGLASGLVRRGALRFWAVVPGLPLAAALARCLDGPGRQGSLWDLGPGLVLEGLGWLVAFMAVVLWLYTRRPRPPFERQEPLSTVIAAEDEYLRARRGLADLPPEGRPAALAFSGGGVRSATTNLGVLQRLARLDLLPRVDYLSTVSGGGYIGAALSSLLSMRRPREGDPPCGGAAQYLFGADDEPRFSVDCRRFPFRESGGDAGRGAPDATAQVDHLRASGKYLVGRTGPFSGEFLRTVGTLVFGVVTHVLHFGLLAVSLAAGYLWVIWLMVGSHAVERGAEAAAKPDYLSYVRGALGLGRSTDLWDHPFTFAFVAGFLVALFVVLAGRWLLSLLDPARLEAPGRTREAVEEGAATLTLILVMLFNAVIVTWWHIAQGDSGSSDGELLNISLPLVSYIGGGALLFCRWAWVSTLSAPLAPKTRRRWARAVDDGYHRTDRSLLSARAGGVLYLIGASLVLVLLVLPFLLFFQEVVDFFAARQVKSFFAWAASVAGARYLARGAAAAARPAGGRFSSVMPALKQFLASVAFVIAVLGALLLICAVIWRRAEPEWRLPIALVSLALYLAFGRLLDFNKLSLHYFYRDRLAEAFLLTLTGDPGGGALRCLRDNEAMRLTDLHGVRPGHAAATAAPYHLIVTCLNLSAGDDRQRRGRRSDSFVLSKLYCGSATTGYARTDRCYADETLAGAMTLSGAAASPAMGSHTSFVQAASMTLLNLRLGQWVQNPARRDPASTGGGVFWPPYLFREMVGSTSAGGTRVYLSDGGHCGDNLGIYPLLQRRCRLVLAVDVEEDPDYVFHSLNEAMRQIEIDQRITVDIRLDPLRPESETGQSARHWALGLITYPPSGDRPREHGWLLLFKPSISGDEPEPILNYRRENPAFPQQSTGDQFFDEAQFEAYRTMGHHLLDSCPEGLLSRLFEESPSPELFSELDALQKAAEAPR